MNFEFDETEQMLADSVTRYMTDNAGLEQGRQDAALPDGFARDAWETCAEMGWLAAPFAEESGGFGLGAVGSMIVHEAVGAGLSPLPMLTGVTLAGRMLEEAGDKGAEALGALIGGEKLFAVAMHETGKGYDFANPGLTATQQEGKWILSGEKSAVLNGSAADMLIVTAQTDADELALFIVDGKAQGLSRRDISLADNRRAAQLTFDQVTIDGDARLDNGNNGQVLLERAMQETLIAAASENLGAMQAAFDMTLDYAKTRKQFGQPLGKFQVLQHRLVDMSIKVEEARSLVMAAAMALREGHEEAPSMAIAAWVQSIWSGRKVGEESIQIHGGIGMTDELAIGDYVKRIAVNELLFGISRHHIERYNRLCD